MSKRFTDSRKWDDPFFLDLKNDHKLIWIYLLDNCDHAGIYTVNIRLLNFCLNTSLTEEAILLVIGSRIKIIDSETWFIPNFIEFQYGGLDSNNRVHASIQRILKKEGALTALKRPVQGRKDKDKVKDKVKDKDNKVIDLIIEDLNLICKSSYKLSGTKTREQISVRLKEGFTLDNFKAVHRNKYAEWTGTDMEKFLRPETLYGNKFEGYLNQPIKKKKDGYESHVQRS